MGKLYLGFDAGTQSVKVAVYDSSWTKVASHSLPTTLGYPNPGWVQMDADEYVANTVTCMKACSEELRRKGYNPADVAAIMGDGIICGITGIDADGNAITPFINYLDSRTKEDVDAINSTPREIWGRETGNPEASCMFPAMFARWFLKNSDAFKERGVKFVHDAPYILMHLAGLKAEDAFIDWGTMSGWGLGYRVMDKVWSEEQLEILGIDPKYMPKILKPWDIVGKLTAEMAEKTGFAEGTLVCAGAGDTMQSMLGSGVFESGQGVDVAGTCSMFCVSTDGIVPELSKPGSGLIFNSGSLPDTYFYWGYIRTGGLALRWFKDNICLKSDDPKYYVPLSEMAEKVPAGCNGVLFLPYLTGGTGDEANASGCFLNLTLDDDQGVMWRAVLEAIGYDYMEITDTYRASGVPLKRITVTEGGSRDSLWNQIKADMLASDVVRFRNAGGAVVTNCVFAALASGGVKDVIPALQKTIVRDASYAPNPANSELYRDLFMKKVKLVKQDMREAFKTLRSMKSFR
ncbi:FGGY-family carbohydrate kinase [Dakarella massiliensis]|uniref:FGGY-family carbohydrate kinase n=1 Tax=Dakarella massiliensis TaxID=1506471 RepID=UPI000670C652|nr:FGGY family carbohydrate kinase [Dakarella massiliensis]